MSRLEIILLLPLFFACYVHSSPCPSVEDMSPCTCKSVCPDCPAEMSCTDILNVQQLRTVFENTRNYTFEDLTVENSSFPFLPSEWIEEKEFRSLHLRNNFMIEIFDIAPTSNYLNEILINNTLFQRSLKFSLFSNLTDLRKIVVVNTQVKRINKRLGDSLPSSLKHIWLEDTKSKGIESGSFEKLKNLETLYINNSNIRELDRSIFPRPSTLKAFTISNSRVETIPEDMFREMPELRNIGLFGNFISEFNRSVFESVLPQLSMLSLADNPLLCDCDAFWVTEVSKFPHFFYAKCKELAELHDKRLNLLEETDFRQCYPDILSMILNVLF